MASYLDGTYWEEWHFRFNVGNKQNRPVKFFAYLTWRSDLSKQICPFRGSRWDYPSIGSAEEDFAGEITNWAAVSSIRP